MTSTGWNELARAVVRRRNELGLTQEQVTARGGPSTATIRLIESAGQENYRGRTLFALDLAMGWDEGTSWAISREEVDSSWPFRVFPRDPVRDEPPGHSDENDPAIIAREQRAARRPIRAALAEATRDEILDELRSRLFAHEAMQAHYREVEAELSAPDDSLGDLVAADEQDQSISGENEAPTEP